MEAEPDSLSWLVEHSAILARVLFLIILLICSALISGAEVALFSLSQTDLNELEETSTSGKIVAKLLAQPKKLLATILITNNLINISIVLIFSKLEHFIFPYDDYNVFYFLSLKQIINVGVVTFLILFFGEILPKIYASRNKIRFASAIAYPIFVLDVLFSFLSVPMGKTTSWIQNKFTQKKSLISVGQLSQALELTSGEDTTHKEKKLLQGIVSFGNTETRQVMCPRIDIFALNENTPFNEVLSSIIEHGYSRIPVFQENIDHITGVIYVKDLLPFLNEKPTFSWQHIIRKPFFVPESKKLDDLMKVFQEKKIHLAVVVDEYGGTSGLITLEDILEEIVGDISDEFDQEDVHFVKIDGNTFIFEGKTAIKDLYRIMNFSEEDQMLFENNKGEAETIAGFVLEIAGKFPNKGSVIPFQKYAFTIEAKDKKRIKEIKVKRSA